MVSIARKNLFQEPVRLLISVGGVAFSVLLMLFLLGVYRGVLLGSVTYVDKIPSELWVCQKGTRNLIRSSSFFPGHLDSVLKKIAGVRAVASITRSFASARIKDREVTMFLLGFDAESGVGGPPEIVAGTARLAAREMVVDRAFAAKRRLQIGDTVAIGQTRFVVKGLSAGTNIFAAQFSFIRKDEAQAMIGLAQVVSFFLITLEDPAAAAAVSEKIVNAIPGAVVMPKAEFMSNNREEVEVGFAPILFAVLLMGAFVGTVVISLTLFTATMEKRHEYAVLKALGAGNGYLAGVILQQALWNGVLGFLAGVGLLMITANGIERLVPEVSIVLSSRDFAAIFISACLMGGLSSFMPVRRILRIHPAEVFRL